MSETAAKLQSRAVRAAAIYQRDANLFQRYHGGVPIGFMAAAAQRESDGRMDAPGDAGLAEYGIFQISAHTEDEYGVPTNTRKTKLGNFYLMGLDTNAEARRMQLRFPQYATDGSRDQWLLARLAFAIGRPGANKLLNLANLPAGPNFYERFIAWARAQYAAGHLPRLGSQSPAKVLKRVELVLDTWTTGEIMSQQLGVPMQMGIPAAPALMPGLKSMTLPKDIRGHLLQLNGGESPEVVRREDVEVWDGQEASGGAAVLFAGTVISVGIGVAWLLSRRAA